MDVPGIEVLPIRKMTGEYGFAEVLFDDAAIPHHCLVGEEGEGWMVAMATLTFERGATGGQAGGHMRYVHTCSDVVDLAKTAIRDGRRAIEDPLIRDQLVRLIIAEKAIALNRRRLQIEKLNRERPPALWLMSKLSGSEFAQELSKLAVMLQGANARLYMGDPNALSGGAWQRSYLNSFSATIGGGTSEVQRNIIGERLLGLPKD
jgi:alkylation response protein AidB-like acyl-CoA dehydrogenase